MVRTAALTSMRMTRTHKNTVWMPRDTANAPAATENRAQPMVSKMVSQMANAWPRSSGRTTAATMRRLTGGLNASAEPEQRPEDRVDADVAVVELGAQERDDGEQDLGDLEVGDPAA